MQADRDGAPGEATGDVCRSEAGGGAEGARSGESARQDPGGAARSGRIVAVVGPTAAGKSEVAVRVAVALDGEVVSADAMQVYRGLDIGTAKVGPETRARVAHHGLDLVDPHGSFSAGAWARAARAAIDDIHQRGRLPVVAGGSGFYLKALVDGLAPLPRRDRRWRAALEAVEARRGTGHLFAMLERLDPAWAARVGAGDRQRILRGLEMTLRLGRPFSDVLARRQRQPGAYEVVWVGIDRPRGELREAIARRVDAMLEAGWLDEVRRLVEAGVPEDAGALRAIGYRQLADHLRGRVTLEEARHDIVVATRRYARRQLTWFRNQTRSRWFEISGSESAALDRVAVEVLEHVRGRLAGDPPPRED